MSPYHEISVQHCTEMGITSPHDVTFTVNHLISLVFFIVSAIH